MKKFTKIISILLSIFILLSLTSVSVGSVNNDIANSTVTTTAVTDSTILHLNKGDIVTYCLELTVPSHLTDVSGWYIDIFYDKEILQVDRDFASGYGYACGDKAIDYATGLSDTKATLPGGSSTIVNFNNKDAISICDMGPNGLKLLGKTILFKAIERDSLLNGQRFICLNYDDLASGNIEHTLNTAKDKIIVIDNANIILNDLQKIMISMDMNNQYIIFSHSVNGFKPSVKGIAQLIVEGHEGKLIYPLLGVQK